MQSLSLVDVSSQHIRIRIKDVLRHEEVEQADVRELKLRIEKELVQRRPIVVVQLGDKWAIIDGHHRIEALEQLGIPCISATQIGFYLSPFVEVWNWKDKRKRHDKIEILQRSLESRLFPQWTTMHMFRPNGGPPMPFHHEKHLQPELNVPIEKLYKPSKKVPPILHLL